MSVFGDFASIAAFTAAMNAFLSNVPGCWASIVSTLAALACPARSSAGASAASCASLAFAAAGGCARFAAAAPFTAPVTWANAGSARRTDAGRGRPAGPAAGRRRAAPRRRRCGPPRPPSEPGAGAAAARRSAPSGRRPSPGFAAAFPSGLTFGTGFGGGTGFFAGTASGPNPVRTTASADAGGFCAAPSRSTGTPAAFAAFSPFSTVSTAGSSRRTSAQRRVDVAHRLRRPDDRIRPASSALTAAFPAARCNASNPGGRAERRTVGPSPALGEGVVAPRRSALRRIPRAAHPSSVAGSAATAAPPVMRPSGNPGLPERAPPSPRSAGR